MHIEFYLILQSVPLTDIPWASVTGHWRMLELRKGILILRLSG